MKYVPNILTSIRIISIPIIIYLFLNNNIELSIIMVAIASITDCFDGYIARKFNVQSDFGAKLDAVSDKFFSAGLLLTLTFKFNILIINVIFELLISFLNLYFYYKSKKTNTLFMGKFKTWFLFVTVILGFVCYFNTNFLFLLYTFCIITALLQLLCIVLYIRYEIKKSKA